MHVFRELNKEQQGAILKSIELNAEQIKHVKKILEWHNKREDVFKQVTKNKLPLEALNCWFERKKEVDK